MANTLNAFRDEQPTATSAPAAAKNALALCMVALFAQPVIGDVIFSHSGSANPTSEGWALTAGGGGQAEAVFGDAGFDAWAVWDDSVTQTGNIYFQTPSAGQSAAIANGWALSTTLRVVEGTTATFDSPFVAFSQGTVEYTVVFDTQADGDPVVRLSKGGNSGDEYAIEGGSGGYHTYVLNYDPVQGSADLFVNGVERISDYTGQSSATSRVAWGAGASDGTGRAHFNTVSFSAVPEPASSAMLLLGIAGMSRLRRRSTPNRD